MKKIENFIAVAQKLDEQGSLEYCLWINDDGALYIQIISNLTDTKNPGSVPKLLFRASDNLSDRNSKGALKEMRGINPITLSEESSNNNDASGFVKAVLKHLFP